MDDPLMNVEWLVEARKIYLASVPGKLADLESAINSLAINPKSQPNERRLRRLLHNLIGSAGSYGFPEGSEIAREMSERLHQRIDACLPADEETISELRALLERLRGSFGG